MTNQPLPQNSKPQTSLTHIPSLTTIAVPAKLFGRKKTPPPSAPTQETAAPQQSPPKPKQKPRGVAAAKFELADEKLKFLASKGLFKKRWDIIKEFPLNEVSATQVHREMFGVTWNEVEYWFKFKKSKKEELSKLHEQIQKLLGERELKKEAETRKAQRVALRKSELLATLNASLPLIDGSFDVLMGLHKKRLNWPLLQGYAAAMASGVSFEGQMLPPLKLDASQVAAAIQNQASRDTSKEAFNVIKAIHGYFADLKDEAELVDVAPNCEHVRLVVFAYLALNDLMFAKVVKEKDSQKEVAFFEETLQGLAGQTRFRVDAEELVSGLEGLGVEADREGVVLEVRGLFRGQLSQL
ncbi:MAG: hypothetical protein NWE93_04935 [Candidatus Bathyarchaeota archaeon]|nr:hypothetical protein [Candidatus Bathyarchaeota archaeon]